MVNKGENYFPLGMESGAIQNNQISSNDVYTDLSQSYFPSWRARLNTDPSLIFGREGNYWRPGLSSWTTSWIQVRFVKNNIYI